MNGQEPHTKRPEAEQIIMFRLRVMMVMMMMWVATTSSVGPGRDIFDRLADYLHKFSAMNCRRHSGLCHPWIGMSRGNHC
mmetsp:Transcript_752/g.1598  ORF Transcript_752/g.1598 Transcript_752/m.1598 type:complete len:80 (-) Transcript_752:1054-1293(-)